MNEFERSVIKREAARMKALVELAHHLRRCLECGETDVMKCLDGKQLWEAAGMPADPTSEAP